jgi:hypothetical protein
MRFIKSVFIQIILIFSTSFFLQARYHKVTRMSDFEKLVDVYEYSVVCFAPAGQMSEEDIDRDELKDRKKDFKFLENLLRSVSKNYDYKNFLDKDIGFIAVDVAGKYAGNVIAEYGLVQMPSCFIFDQGENTKQKVIRPSSPKDLTRLLERVGGTDFQKLLADRKAEYSQERQERIARYYAYGAYPYGYGYWGWGWGYGPYWYGRYGRYGCCW